MRLASSRSSLGSWHEQDRSCCQTGTLLGTSPLCFALRKAAQRSNLQVCQNWYVSRLHNNEFKPTPSNQARPFHNAIPPSQKSTTHLPALPHSRTISDLKSVRDLFYLPLRAPEEAVIITGATSPYFASTKRHLTIDPKTPPLPTTYNARSLQTGPQHLPRHGLAQLHHLCAPYGRSSTTSAS